MMAKPADLAQYNVKRKAAPVKAAALPQDVRRPSKLITKGFRITPEAAHQFEMLRAEIGGGRNKDVGPKLIAEALNLLFTKYKKPTIAA